MASVPELRARLDQLSADKEAFIRSINHRFRALCYSSTQETNISYDEEKEEISYGELVAAIRNELESCETESVREKLSSFLIDLSVVESFFKKKEEMESRMRLLEEYQDDRKSMESELVRKEQELDRLRQEKRQLEDRLEEIHMKKLQLRAEESILEGMQVLLDSFHS